MSQIAKEELKKKFAQFMKEEYGYKGKYIDKVDPTHGRCCTCQECGHYHDECVCENNRIYQFLKAL